MLDPYKPHSSGLAMSATLPKARLEKRPWPQQLDLCGSNAEARRTAILYSLVATCRGTCRLIHGPLCATSRGVAPGSDPRGARRPPSRLRREASFLLIRGGFSVA